MTIEGVLSQLIVKTISNPKFDMVDFHLLLKVLAKRMKQFVPNFIHTREKEKDPCTLSSRNLARSQLQETKEFLQTVVQLSGSKPTYIYVLDLANVRDKHCYKMLNIRNSTVEPTGTTFWKMNLANEYIQKQREQIFIYILFNKR